MSTKSAPLPLQPPKFKVTAAPAAPPKHPLTIPERQELWAMVRKLERVLGELIIPRPPGVTLH